MTIAGLPEPLSLEGTSHTVEIDGVRIHYNKVDKVGSGTPVIFTHGGGPGASGWNNFLYNARAFAERYPCYFYDMPPYGGSAKVRIDGPVYSWEADKFLKFMDAVGIDRAHLVNQSFGGGMAVKVAATAPHRVDHLVTTGAQPILHGVVAPILMTIPRRIVQDYYLGAEGPTLEKMRAIIADLEFHDPGKVTDLNVRLRFEASNDPDLLKLVAIPGHRGKPESLIELFQQVTARTLIVHGGHDFFGGVDLPMLMLNQFADARLHVIRNAAHHVQTECPHEYNAVVLGFLP